MKILTLENKTYILEKIPEYVDDKLRFAVLDNSNPADPDYFFIPLIHDIPAVFHLIFFFIYL